MVASRIWRLERYCKNASRTSAIAKPATSAYHHAFVEGSFIRKGSAFGTRGDEDRRLIIRLKKSPARAGEGVGCAREQLGLGGREHCSQRSNHKLTVDQVLAG